MKVMCCITGPGNGLRLYLNIEHYEYTRDPSKGIGVKVSSTYINSNNLFLFFRKAAE